MHCPQGNTVEIIYTGWTAGQGRAGPDIANQGRAGMGKDGQG